jgi:stalled ribosome alternative rescue factor ArfA
MGKAKKIKPRNHLAKELWQSPEFRPRVVTSKKTKQKLYRKRKHKNDQ